MDAPPEELRAPVIDRGDRIIYLTPLLHSVNIENTACVDLLRGWSYTTDLDLLILFDGNKGYYLPLSILDLTLKDFELAVIALRGAIPDKEPGLYRCLALALRQMAKEKIAEETEKILIEEGKGRKPGYSSILAKMISIKLSSELNIVTDMLTEISYVKFGIKYIWGTEADNYIAKRAHELGIKIAEVVAREARVPIIRIRSALNDNVIREVLKELKRESMLPSTYVSHLISRGLKYVAYDGGYLDLDSWFRYGVMKFGIDDDDVIVLHVLPQRSFDVNIVLKSVNELEGLDAIETIAERYTPKFLEAMREWIPDDEMRLNLWKAFGYSIYPKMPFRNFFVLVGPPGAGKSTFLDFLHHALGLENVAAVSLSQILGPKSEYYVAELHHKLANLGDEGLQSSIHEFKHRSFEILKNLVGGSYITARTLYSKPFKFINYAKLFFAINDSEPIVQLSRDPAVAKRLIVVEFSKSFEDNPDFKERILKEAEKSLPVMLVALRVLAKEGFTKRQESNDLFDKFVELCDLYCKRRSDGYFLSSSIIRKRLKVSPDDLCANLRSRGIMCRKVVWHGRRGIVISELDDIVGQS